MDDQAQQAVEVEDLAAMLDGDAPETEEEEGQADAEAAEGEEEQQAEDQEEQAAEPERYRVTVKNDRGEDEEKDLSLEELAEGYMLQADYTRKRQADAEQARQLQYQAAQTVAQEQQRVAESIGQLQQLVLQKIAPELANLTPQLAQTDPGEYVRLQAMQLELNQVMQGLNAQKSAYQQQVEQVEQQQRQQMLQADAAYLKQAVPEFEKPDYSSKLLDFASNTYGVPKEEIAYLANRPIFKDGRVLDSGRVVQILHDAMQWRTLQQQKPAQMKKVAAAPKVIKPAAPQPKNRGGELTKRLQKSGRVEDLAEFL
jgi:hypothetical protein